ncbi:MAG: AI-2E family transporter, partial [Candidatus Aenigmarchaeota archaeon]|nr:AI-2E family transporter [Candidatus Aenigmarchaeota archaeon]
MSIVKRTGNVFAKRKKSSISSKKVGRSTNDPKSVLAKSGISVREIFLILSILVVAFFSLLLIKPYFQYIISAMILSFIFFPMYKKINHRFTNQSVASGVMIVLILLMVIIPISYVVSQLVVQTMSVMNNMDPSQTLNTTMLDEFTLTISNIVGQEILFDEFLAEFSSAGKDFVLSSAPQIFGSLTSIFLGLFIMLFIMFYLFKDGETLVGFLLKLSPIKEENEHRLMEEFSKVTKGVIYGQIVIGIFQGTLAGIGYIAFGVPAPILLGFI